ncbi:hypothetical protein PanWU01x14_248520, partial [Parasponia andersonii]
MIHGAYSMYTVRRWESGGTCGWRSVGERQSMKPYWRCNEFFGFLRVDLEVGKGKEPISTTLAVHIWTFGLECNKAADWAVSGFQIWLLTISTVCTYISFSLSHGDYIERFVLYCSLAFKFDTVLCRNSFNQND